jgi:integrase
MTKEELNQVINHFALRERLILKLTGIAGMRPGEVYAVKWGDQSKDGFRITRPIYRGKLDSPESSMSVRLAALGPSITTDLNAWRSLQRDIAPNAWVFPSEKGTTPLNPSNHWRRTFLEPLDTMGFKWVNYQVLRRRCSSLLNDLGIDGKLVSQQLGHTLDSQPRHLHQSRARTTKRSSRPARSSNQPNGVLQ